MSQAPTATIKLDAMGIDDFCNRIVNGDSYTVISAELQISRASISNWLALDAERSARAREALILAAATSADKAEAVLLGHVKDAEGKAIDPATKRELAFHYRWLARVRNPKDYGEKLQVDSTSTVINLSDEQIALRAAKLEAELASFRLPAPPTGEA